MADLNPNYKINDAISVDAACDIADSLDNLDDFISMIVDEDSFIQKVSVINAAKTQTTTINNSSTSNLQVTNPTDSSAVNSNATTKSNPYTGSLGSSGRNWTSNSGVSFSGVQTITLNALQDLADKYKTIFSENLLVISCIEKSDSSGTYNHANGWKLNIAGDVLNPSTSKYNETKFLEFKNYMLQKGVIIYDEYNRNSKTSTTNSSGHLDLSLQGYNGTVTFAGFS